MYGLEKERDSISTRKDYPTCSPGGEMAQFRDMVPTPLKQLKVEKGVERMLLETLRGLS